MATNTTNSGNTHSSSDFNHCDQKWYDNAGIQAEIPVYYVLVPILILFGLIGHTICLLAFYKQSKKESAYFYQVALTVGETCQIIFFAGYCGVMIFYWSPTGMSKWFTDNYVLMWYTAHLTVPLINMVPCTNLLLAVFMAADRVFALWRPMKYKGYNHKWLRSTAVLLSIFLGVSTSIFDCFRYKSPTIRKGIYFIFSDFVYQNSITLAALSRFRDAFRMLILLALFGLNVALIIKYRKQKKKIVQTSSSNTMDGKKERKKQKGEMALLLLTTFQCLFTAISTSASMAYYIALSIKPSFDRCEGLLWGPILDAVVELMETVNFYVILIVSKQLRHLIRDNISCFKRIFGSSSQASQPPYF